MRRTVYLVPNAVAFILLVSPIAGLALSDDCGRALPEGVEEHSEECDSDSILNRRGLTWDDVFRVLQNARNEACCNHAGGTYYPADPGYAGSACALETDEQVARYDECMEKTRPRYW